MNYEKKITDILVTLTDITGFDHSTSALEAFNTAEGELNQLIEQAEDETIKKVLEVIGKKKREASDSIRIKADNFFSIGAMFVLDDLIASLQEEPEPNTEE